jgi:hypothetical protein
MLRCITTISSSTGQLLLVSIIFMAIFQLVARLISYSFMFHQGVLLLSAALIGGGISILGFLSLKTFLQKHVVEWLPVSIAGLFFTYLVTYLYTQSLVIHFVVLSLLFGGLFLAVTRFITLRSDTFMGVDLLGSFLGAVAVVGLSHLLLEEWLIVILIVVTTVYALATVKPVWYRRIPGVVLLLAGGCLVYLFSSQSLLELVRCTDSADTYKTICYDERGLGQAVASYPSIKGRSDVYLIADETPSRLSVYNNGLHAGTTLDEDYFLPLAYSFYEVEIPKLDYHPNSEVITLGASTGANILTLQKYIPNADITAVEIDLTIDQLYQEERYLPYLPKRDSFTFVYQDARTIFETTSKQYDVISMLVESVNTTIPGYVDESTSLVYTAEALRTYIDNLKSDGYLIMQQHHLAAVYEQAGDAMINKLLVTLEEATDGADLADSLLLYSYSFYSDPNSLQYLAAVYKPDGFSAADQAIFSDWYTAHQRYVPGSGLSSGMIELLHTPDGEYSYDSFFDQSRRAELADTFSINVITDDRPFRHLITTLPFPLYYYTLIIGAIAVMVIWLPHIQKVASGPAVRLALLSFVIGLVTFGFQYVLYYKTAAFLDTNLIFFAVFLLIPLFFGAIGGAFSLRISTAVRTLSVIITIAVAGLFITQPLFSLAPVLVFSMIAWLFIFSGMLFPLLLTQTDSAQLRTLLYGYNICGGGVATIVMITAHATAGWIIMFVVVTIAALALFLGLSSVLSKQ